MTSREPARPPIEVSTGRRAEVGGATVLRTLPRRERRTVGAWCFVDQMLPPGEAAAADPGLKVGPHPHIGLQTLTWLLAGEGVHRDSLGSEQVLRPGQLNLMTAGHGVSHAEESPPGFDGELRGVQLWIAQPERTRHGKPEFAHHPELPQSEVGGARATVLVGEFAGGRSPARRDTDHVGVQLQLQEAFADLPLESTYEYAITVLSGRLHLEGTAVGDGDGTAVGAGQLAYLGLGRDEIRIRADEPTLLLLLGGTPFETRPLMWWNFVARTREEIDTARAEWELGSDRFGETGSQLARIPAPLPPWTAESARPR